MKLEARRTVAHSKLEMIESTPLGLPGRVVANLWIFPLLGKKEAELVPATQLVPGAGPWAGQSAAALGVVCFFLALAGGIGESGKGTGLRGEQEVG